MSFSPMLASSAVATDETIARLQGTHYFELKLDGVRGIFAINKGSVKITNRNAVDITYRYPELVQAALLKFGPDAQVILDGEIAVTGPDKMPSFKLTSKRDRQQRVDVIAALSASMPATFFAFDILYKDAVDARSLPFSQRTVLLAETLAAAEPSERIVGNMGSPNGQLMLDFVREHRLEGLVAKLVTSPYQSGRRSSWVKIKPVQTGSFFVTGTTVGSGARKETFGALSLAVVMGDDTLLPVGEVGSGFKQRDLIEVLECLAAGDLIVEVEYLEYTVDGSLRFPVFKGIRTDLRRSDANHTQLGAGCAESTSSSATLSTSTLSPGSS